MKTDTDKLPSARKGSPFTPESPYVAIVDPKEFSLDGLYLSGQVIGRQRREFDTKAGGKRFVISLTVLTQTGTFKPERWCDTPAPSGLPVVGDHVCLRVGLSVYQSKGGTNFRLTWGDQDGGTNF